MKNHEKNFEQESMNSGKEIYDRIEIPNELKDVVNRAIQSVDKENILKKNRQQVILRVVKYAGGLAAALLIATTIGLNTSQAFAEALSDVPLVGTISRVLTVRSYTEQEDTTTLYVKVPEVQKVEDTSAQDDPQDDQGFGAASEIETDADATDTDTSEEFIADINAEINQIVDDYISNAQAEVEEYKKAFLETGGTEEEWNERAIDISVTYDVKYQYGPYLSLVLYNSQSWAAYTEERVYYNLDLKNNRILTLKDILGENYVEIANAAIVEQIEDRIENEDLIFWGFNSSDDTGAIEGFTTVDENTRFYINADGNPVVVFPKYEIGPGYIGIQEFEIEGGILSGANEANAK